MSEASAWQTARGALPIWCPAASSTGNSSPASSVSVLLLGMLAQVPLGLLAARRQQRQQRERDAPEDAVQEPAQEDRLVQQLHVADPERDEPDGERDRELHDAGELLPETLNRIACLEG